MIGLAVAVHFPSDRETFSLFYLLKRFALGAPAGEWFCNCGDEVVAG